MYQSPSFFFPYALFYARSHLICSMSALLDLPDDVLKLLLTYVPLKYRIGSFCLVNIRLHAAAVAATQQVHLRTYESSQTVQSLELWLSYHGQHVTELQLEDPFADLRNLPCANLLELRLKRGSVQLGPTAGGRAGVVEGIPMLTRLELEHTHVIDGPDGPNSLSKLQHLRHLHWGVAGQGQAGFTTATLPRLQHLTHFSGCLPPATLAQLSALTSLQELCLQSDEDLEDSLSPSSVSSLLLPASLTKLELTNRDADGYCNSAAGVNFALLANAPTALCALCFDWMFWWEEVPPPLLSWMARLQSLTQLELYAWGDIHWPPPGPAYSALTASTSLVSLEVIGELPAGVWPFVFGAAHQLPHLTSLVLNPDWVDDGDDDNTESSLAFGPADVACLVRCCPQLRAISHIWLEPGQHVSQLHTLTALTHLHACCTAGDLGAVQGLAAATRLQNLVMDMGAQPAAFSAASLLPLVALSSLTRLRCTYWHKEETAPQRLEVVEFDTKAGSPPDVWVQLVRHCAAMNPGHQPAALAILAQLTEKQAQLAAQQQQQHAVQQSVAAEQAATFAAVVDQLQQLLVG